MTDFLVSQVDKFVFRVAKDCLYNPEGIWLKEVEGSIIIGITDYVQQRSGDVAFIDLKPSGTQIEAGEEIASVETIKVDDSINCPITGTITLVNPKMATEPEIINLDPFGEGWLCELQPLHWETDCQKLLTAEAYFELMSKEAEEEAKKG